MKLSLMVAMDRNRVIGKDNTLPWRLSADLKHFKAVTMGKPIIMGRKTHDSIGKPLPGRKNIVLSRGGPDVAPGCLVVENLEQALAAVKEVVEAVVIGGAGIYELCLPQVSRLYVTHVEAEVEGDVFFPSIHWEEWQEVSRMSFAADEKNEYPFIIATYDRRPVE